MARIDSHQHFWKFDPVRDSWIDESMSAIAQDFLPQDLAPILAQHQFDGCVVVQSDQSEAENDFQLQNAANFPFIKGVVGWVDLRSDNVEERLQEYQKNSLMKGFRHVLQGESNRALMLDPNFKQGLKLLPKYNFTYDILIFPDQLKYVDEFFASNEAMPMLLDHIAKPNLKTGDFAEWKKDIQKLAAYKHLYCKVSGLITEADWHNWTYLQIKPCLDIIFDTFGVDRLMFGSDWPVCNLAGGYDKMLSVVKQYTAQLNENEQAKFWGENATKFYNL